MVARMKDGCCSRCEQDVLTEGKSMWGRDYQKEQRRVDLGASDKQEQLHSRAGTGANESLAYELERITCCARIGPNEPLIRWSSTRTSTKDSNAFWHKCGWNMSPKINYCPFSVDGT